MKDIPESLMQATIDLRDRQGASGRNFSEAQVNPNNVRSGTGGTFFESSGDFLKAVQSAVAVGGAASITFGSNSHPVEESISLADGKSSIGRIHINRSGTYSFKNLQVSNIDVRAENVSLVVDGCMVGRLHLLKGVGAKLKAKNTNFGMLRIDGAGCRALTIRGGHVLDFGLPPADGDNPFTGDVKVANVAMPVRPYKAQLATGQVYRNMQAHLADLKNFPLRDHFHALEMELDRKSNPRAFSSFVSFAYDLFARYGLSASRPLLWLFGLTAGSALLSGFLGLGVCELGERYGWRKELKDGSWYCGMLLGTTPLTNPLGLFSKDPIAVAKTGYWAAWLTVQGLLSAVLIALALLAIRRKFRTQE